MNKRVEQLRKESFETPITISVERAELITDFYAANIGKFSVPVMRAKALEYLYSNQTLHIGDGELVVGERGPTPRAVSTYPELTCHSEEDLRILNSRSMTSYGVSDDAISVYRDKVIPFWQGRTMRDRIFEGLSDEWQASYEAGVFTEFMEQRAPGHTTLDGKFYSKGLLGFKSDIADSLEQLDFMTDVEAVGGMVCPSLAEIDKVQA